MGNEFKLRYMDGESGWAEWVGTHRARINNIPGCRRLNLRDLVEVETDPRDDMPRAGIVLEKVYEGKTFICYKVPDFEKLCDLLEEAGCPTEGLYDGVMAVAHKSDVNPLELARSAGFTVQEKT